MVVNRELSKGGNLMIQMHTRTESMETIIEKEMVLTPACHPAHKTNKRFPQLREPLVCFTSFKLDKNVQIIRRIGCFDCF